MAFVTTMQLNMEEDNKALDSQSLHDISSKSETTSELRSRISSKKSRCSYNVHPSTSKEGLQVIENQCSSKDYRGAFKDEAGTDASTGSIRLCDRDDCCNKTLWKRVKDHYNLVDFHSLPDYLQDNEFILKYYRADWPLKQTLLSIFSIHNETLNIWTHLLGFFLFLGLTIYTSLKLPKVVELPTLPTILPSLSHILGFTKLHLTFAVPYFYIQKFAQFLKCLLLSSLTISSPDHCITNPITRWPFFVFLVGAMFCLLTSSTCHLLSCHSQRLSTFLWKMDYAGIATMIATSYFPPIYYTFLCKPFWRYFYLVSISILGVVTVSVSLVPIFQAPSFRSVRALLFFGMGLSGVVPGTHKLLAYWNDPMCFSTLAHEITMGCFYVLGVFFYATRIPERWKPGWFDIAGHSHQIFHVLVIAGAYTHYKAGLVYLAWRDSHGCDT